jgi:hypothetical protein
MKGRRLLCKAFIFEVIGVSLCEYVVREGVLIVCLTSLKELLFLVYQNFLLVCDLIVSKLPEEFVNEASAAWKLKLLLHIRLRNKPLNEDNWMLIEKNSEEMIHQFQNIALNVRLSCKLKCGAQPPLLNSINSILHEVDKYTAYKAKEIILNSLNESVINS